VVHIFSDQNAVCEAMGFIQMKASDHRDLTKPITLDRICLIML
jgi:hypothetical protein